MSQPNTPVLVVVGATGYVGQHIVSRALRSSQWQVRVIVRDVEKARKLFQKETGIEYVKGEITDPTSAASGFVGASAVVISLRASSSWGAGSPYNVEYKGTVNAIDAAKANDARRIALVGSFRAHKSNFLNWAMNIVRGKLIYWKLAAEEYLRKSGVEYTILRPPIVRNVEGGKMAYAVAQAGKDDSDLGFSIAVDDFADAVLQALTDETTKNVTLDIASSKSRKDGPPTTDWHAVFLAAGLTPEVGNA